MLTRKNELATPNGPPCSRDRLGLRAGPGASPRATFTHSPQMLAECLGLRSGCWGYTVKLPSQHPGQQKGGPNGRSWSAGTRVREEPEGLGARQGCKAEWGWHGGTWGHWGTASRDRRADVLAGRSWGVWGPGWGQGQWAVSLPRTAARGADGGWGGRGQSILDTVQSSRS